MKITVSKRVLAVAIAITLFLSALNTYLILEQNRALQDAAHDSTYDYVIFQDGTAYKAVNQASGSTDYVSEFAAQVLSQALANGNAVYIKPGNYSLTSDVQVYNKINAKIVSDGASIIGNGHGLIVKGEQLHFLAEQPCFRVNDSQRHSENRKLIRNNRVRHELRELLYSNRIS